MMSEYVKYHYKISQKEVKSMQAIVHVLYRSDLIGESDLDAYFEAGLLSSSHVPGRRSKSHERYHSSDSDGETEVSNFFRTSRSHSRSHSRSQSRSRSKSPRMYHDTRLRLVCGTVVELNNSRT